MQEKVCSICKAKKDAEKDFYKHPTTKDGLFPYCKKCQYRPKSKAKRQKKRKKDKAILIDKSRNGTVNWEQLNKFLKQHR